MLVGCRLDLVCLKAPVARKQIRVVLPALLVLRDPSEDILKPGPFINTACLAGGEEGVDDSGSLGGFVIAAEQIVLPSDGKGTDAVLHHVVVNLVAPIGGVERQLLQDFVFFQEIK